MRKQHSHLPVNDAGVRLADALAAGYSLDAVKRDVRAGRLSRPHRGLVTAPGDKPDLARLRAAMHHVGPESMAVIRSSALLHGLQGVPHALPPQIAVPPGLEKRQRAGIDLHFWDLAEDELTNVDGLSCTRPTRTLADACRLLPRMEGVSLVDSALHLHMIGLDDLDAIAAMMRRRRHCVAGRSVLRLARPGAQSPLETRVRVIATDAGLPPDALQVPVLDCDGMILGYADMGYRLPNGGLLAVEADGVAVHSLPDALLHDRRRQNAFMSSAGVFAVRFTWADTRTPAYIPSVLRPLLMTAGWEPPRRS